MAQVNGHDERHTAEPAAQISIPQPESQTPLADPLLPATSLEDSGQGKRPRDARLLHIILANLGVQAYQERVPLQLMDFAYRYTSSIMQDALHLTSEAYGTSSAPSNKSAGPNDLSTVTLQSLRLAIASRQHYQFAPCLPREHFQELAAERNRVTLPVVSKNTAIRLPPERYCLTGVGYNIRDEWDEEADLDAASDVGADLGDTGSRTNGVPQSASNVQEATEPEDMEGKDEEMEDV